MSANIQGIHDRCNKWQEFYAQKGDPQIQSHISPGLHPHIHSGVIEEQLKSGHMVDE